MIELHLVVDLNVDLETRPVLVDGTKVGAVKTGEQPLGYRAILVEGVRGNDAEAVRVI